VTKKLVLVSLVVGLFLSVAIYSSFALFSARSTGSGGSFTVGTLDLSVADAAGGSSEKFVIDNIGVDPNPKGSKIWLIKNTGTLPGKLTLSTGLFANNENGCNSQEALVDTTCGNPGVGEGELGNVIQVRISVDDKEVVPWTKAFTSKEALSQAWSKIPPIVLAGGSQSKLTLDWQINEADYGNEIQSDSLEFSINFNIQQVPG